MGRSMTNSEEKIGCSKEEVSRVEEPQERQGVVDMYIHASKIWAGDHIEATVLLLTLKPKRISTRAHGYHPRLNHFLRRGTFSW
jgi:hypothetical protein